jgi:hypothetical protein
MRADKRSRTDFIILDYRAKKLGGINKLSKPEQNTYVKTGYSKGFLKREVVEELVNELHLDLDLESFWILNTPEEN